MQIWIQLTDHIFDQIEYVNQEANTYLGPACHICCAQFSQGYMQVIFSKYGMLVVMSP